MSKSAAKPNPFHNLSTEDLADQFGDVKAQIAALEDREDALKKELAARIDDVPAIGPRWTVTKSESVSRRLDTQALRELHTWAERGYDLSITPDGPRGPRYVVADGAVALAQITGLPLLPAAYHLNWKITLKSWDGFQIPLPFARCEVTAGRVIYVSREASDEQREKLRAELQAELRAISRD